MLSSCSLSIASSKLISSSRIPLSKSVFFELSSINDFSLDLFVLVKAIKMNYTILEYPVMFKNRYYGMSKGGGSFIGKIKLTLRTLSYINKLRISLKK